jgi:hypothetical protein
MAIQLSVSQSGGKLRVYASNNGPYVSIIDHISLRIDGDSWTWIIFKYQDDFYFGSGRVGTGWGGLMFEMNYSNGPAQAQAKADYWDVDKAAASPVKNLI